MPLPLDPAQVPWSLVLAIGSMSLIYLLYRARPDVLEESGLRAREVALVILGSLGGWAANVPFAIFGGTYLAVNVGGTIVALILIATWIKQKKLSILPAILGTALVALVAWKIVVFSPDEGIIARYPTFFLPVAAALAFALLASPRRPSRSAPIAYTIGTLGALIGADVMHVGDMRAHFDAAGSQNTIISIGGAGVLDMVFLAGTVAMALDLAIVVALAWRRPRTDEIAELYPGRPIAIEDAPRVLREHSRIHNPHALDRALASLAKSDEAIRERDYAKSIRQSWLAVDSMLKDDDTAKHVANGAHPDLHHDLDALRAQYVETRTLEATLQQAGEANVAAKTLIGALARKTSLRPTLDGVIQP